MAVQRITLKNFRCFTGATFELAPVTLIQGPNGSGKTSLLEALHYGCYLRSFRTHLPAQLCRDDNETASFSLTIDMQDDSLSVAVLGEKRVVKLNGNVVKKYSELVKGYRVVTFIEDDLEYIRGYPQERRALIDSALAVHQPGYHDLLRKLQKVVVQRNKILQSYPLHEEQYSLWTEQLIEISKEIISRRKAGIARWQEALNQVYALYEDKGSFAAPLTLEYQEKRCILTEHDLQQLRMDELRAQRTIFGPHLDDILITIYERNGRTGASRGQQKLALMLLKIAQATLFLGEKGDPQGVLFLVDDFLTDFDEQRVEKLLNLLFKLGVQLVITTPQPHALLYSLCAAHGDYALLTIPDQILDKVDQIRLSPHFVGKKQPQEVTG